MIHFSAFKRIVGEQIDVQSRIILGVSACLASICIIFGVYRALIHEYDKATLLLWTFLLTAAVGILIFTGRQKVGRLLFVAIMFSVLSVINLKFQTEQILWQYPGIVALTFALRGYKEVLIICSSLVAINTSALAGSAETNLLLTYASSQISMIVLCGVAVELLMSNIRVAKGEAETDSLTGLQNRKAFDRYFKTLFEGSKLGGKSVLCLIDIDRFKQINDTYGHIFGDAVLRTIAKTIKASIRHNDLAFRYGGEEFAVLLPRTELVLGRLIAERIRIAIENLPIPTEHNEIISCTVSIGVALNTEQSAHTWLSICDSLLYAAKREGRNCIRYKVNDVYS